MMFSGVLGLLNKMLSLFGVRQKTPEERAAGLWMRRILFGAVFLLCVLAFVAPEWLAARLVLIENIMPPWFLSGVAAMFAWFFI